MDKQEFKDACYEVLEILKYVKRGLRKNSKRGNKNTKRVCKL